MHFRILLASTVLAAPTFAQGDDCAGATALSLGATPFDTSTATFGAHPWPCAGGGGPDLWWTFTAPNAASYTFETCGSSYDTAIHIIEGTCNAPIDLQCNDDDCGTSSLVTQAMLQGESVFVRVGGFGGASGAGTLTVTETIIPGPSGSTAAWLSEVAAGTPAVVSMADLMKPAVVDVGMPSGATGITYEFIVYGDNSGPSTALMGNIAPSVGDASGFKYSQWPQTMEYGVTEFGVVDLSFGVPNNPGADEHLVFVADINASTTTLWRDGVNVGSVPSAPHLMGPQGVGQILRAGSTNIDIMSLGRIRGVAVYDGQLGAPEILAHRDAYFQGSLGMRYCDPAVANSTGAGASMSASGTTVAAANDLTLACADMPTLSFSFFITSQTQGFIPNPAGSQGNLCLSGAIGRFVGPGQIQQSDLMGNISLQIDLTQHPTPNGLVTVQAGETWNFQAWYRDAVGGVATSNFSDGLAVMFQ